MNSYKEVRSAYDILLNVYRDGAYLNIAMKDVTNKRVAKLVYGVLDYHYELNYILNQLAVKGIKNNVRLLALIALYSVIKLQTPENVVINETKDVLEEIGKSALTNFFTAIIKKAVQKQYEYPKKSDKNYIEVKYNLPSWLVGMYKKDYPETFEEIINVGETPFVHIRLNKNCTEEEIKKIAPDAKKTLTGFFVRNSREIGLFNTLGKITYMSYGSTLIAESIHANSGMEILDTCAAPGGKAIYMAQKGAAVIACDIHEHRVDLIRAYADRMHVGVTVYKQDATVFLKKWEERFDVVLIDAPCSGFGVTGKKKDVIFNKTYDDVLALAELQREILDNACKYVKKGGLLVYSTCTVFNKENAENVNWFLSQHPEFKREKIDLPYDNDGSIQFLPDGKGMEGFFVCHMRKA